MAATDLLALCAIVCAGVGGFVLMRTWRLREGRREGTAGLLRLSERSRTARLLRYGFPPLEPMARRLLKNATVKRATDDLLAVLTRRLDRMEAQSANEALSRDMNRMFLRDANGAISLQASSVLSLALFAALLFGVVVSVVTSSLACGIACAGCVLLAVFAHARTVQEKHAEAVREEVPEALRSMEVCFRSGLSLLQTLKQVAHELDGSLGRLFDTAARRLEMGATTTEALSALDTARQVPELTFVAVALDAQHQSGGSIGAVLESAQESVESELELRRSLRVQTAQAKLSARIVTVMPFLLVALFSLMSPGFLEPFFTSLAGMALLVLALGMQITGTLIVHRMLKVHAE